MSNTTKEYLRSVSEYIDFEPEVAQMLIGSITVYDQALYFLRQEYFRCRDLNWSELPKYPSKFDLMELTKACENVKSTHLDINVKKDIVFQARSDWDSWIKSKNDYKKNPDKYLSEPKMPRYKYRFSTYNTITIDKSRFRGDRDNEIKLPCSDTYIKIPDNIKKSWIVMLKIKYVYGRFKVSFIYDNNLKYLEKKNARRLSSKDANTGCLGIDLGSKNVVTGVTYKCSHNQSFIIRGTELKQVIRQVNHKIADLQSKAILCANAEITKISKKDGLLKLYKNSSAMNSLWKYYNDFSETYMHTISNMIIDFCLENRIGTLVVGHNDGWKQESNLTKENNKIFCSIRHSVLIDYLRYKCKDAGITFITTEESYTSKCDHLAGESMEHHEKYFGKRPHRGLFVSSKKGRMNADCNGAIGMLRKANIIRDADIVSLLDRGDIVSPVVVNVKGFKRPKQTVRK